MFAKEFKRTREETEHGSENGCNFRNQWQKYSRNGHQNVDNILTIELY